MLYRSTRFLSQKVTLPELHLATSKDIAVCKMAQSQLESGCCSDSRKCYVSVFGHGKHVKNTLFIPGHRSQTDD